MQNLKRVLAMGLAATLVFGSSLTAFAEDDPYSSTGTGSNEGHVDKHVISVTLPTVATGTTPFNYTVDPERLVATTNGSRYGSTTFTNDAKTNGVYFLTGTAGTSDSYDEVDTEAVDAPVAGTKYYTKSGDEYVEADDLDAWEDGVTYYTKTEGTAGTSQYDSKSNTLTTTSRSSADVKLTVQVAAASNGNVTLVNSAPSTDGYTAVTVADEEAFAAGTFYTESSGTYTKATEYETGTTYYKESAAELYLALMVGSDATPIEAGKTVSKEVTIAGVDGNFETTYDSEAEAYKYTVKSTLASEWNTADFYLTGVASKANAENVTVPTLTVTWKYEDPSASSSTATGIAYTSKAENGDVTLTFTPGTDAKTLATTSFKINGVEASGWSSYSTNVLFNNNVITVKSAVFDFNSIKNATTDNKYVVYFL